MKTKEKSLLDNIPVEDKAFPLNSSKPREVPLDVVSSCPECGAPIYGLKWILPNDNANIKYTCDCHKDDRHKDIKDTMLTK